MPDDDFDDDPYLYDRLAAVWYGQGLRDDDISACMSATPPLCPGCYAMNQRRRLSHRPGEGAFICALADIPDARPHRYVIDARGQTAALRRAPAPQAARAGL